MTGHRWHGGELRADQLSADWTILAPGRDSRPHSDEPASCPFCPGPGEDTPPETWRLAGDDGDDENWRIRAVPNRYALSDRHEVVIETPRHDRDLADATDAEVADVLWAWQQRHRALRPTSAQVVVFRNRGPGAGMSLAHPHSQVAGLPVLSPSFQRELEALRAHHRRHGRLYAEELLESELHGGTRIVRADERVVAFVPFAPVTACETHIVPRTHRADFAEVPMDELTEVARMLRSALVALRDAAADPAYNLIVHTAPTGWEDAPFLCWSIRVYPRTAITAGLELATGIPVITSTPERDAAALRACIGLPSHASTSATTGRTP